MAVVGSREIEMFGDGVVEATHNVDDFHLYSSCCHYVGDFFGVVQKSFEAY